MNATETPFIGLAASTRNTRPTLTIGSNGFPESSANHGNSGSMGTILVDAGRLSPEGLGRILDRQRKERIPFGEAAIALKALTRDDVDFALNRQFDYAYLSPDDVSVRSSVVTAFKPFSRIGENMRALRSQLMLRWFNGDPRRKVLAVVSPGTGDGRTFIASNLAVVFAQQGERTLLIDGDLRGKPGAGLSHLFKLSRGPGLSGILANRAGLDAAQLVPGLPGLAVLAAGATPPNPQELLGRAAFGQLLEQACEQFDVVLIDTPDGSQFADAEIIGSRAGAAFMVTRVNRSQLQPAAQLAQRLQDNGVQLVGAVLNEA